MSALNSFGFKTAVGEIDPESETSRVLRERISFTWEKSIDSSGDKIAGAGYVIVQNP